MNENCHVVLALNVLSSYLFARIVGFVLEAFLLLCDY